MARLAVQIQMALALVVQMVAMPVGPVIMRHTQAHRGRAVPDRMVVPTAERAEPHTVPETHSTPQQAAAVVVVVAIPQDKTDHQELLDRAVRVVPVVRREPESSG